MNNVVYIAVHDQKYLDLTARSIKSVRKHIDKTTITLYSDLNCDGIDADTIIKIDDLIPTGSTTQENCEGYTYFKNKIKILSEQTRSRNLYLDCDIEIVKDTDIFCLLDKFDIAVAHAPHRLSKWSRKLPIPESYPDFNLGLILYKSISTKCFFSEWQKNFEKHQQPHDQTSFRLTAWKSPRKIYVLPPEYNKRDPVFDYGQETKIKH